MKKSNDLFKIIERVGSREKMSDEDIKRVIDRTRTVFGGKHISIPGDTKEAADKRNSSIIRDRENDVPVGVIMTKHGLSRAAVYKILKIKKMQPIRPK